MLRAFGSLCREVFELWASGAWFDEDARGPLRVAWREFCKPPKEQR